MRDSRTYRLFFGAFLDELERLAGDNHFAQSVGDQCPDGYPVSWYSAAVQRKIALYGHDLAWPLSTYDLRHVSDAEILKYVEFFYQLVSKPLDEWEHRFCGASHPRAYDERQGKEEYAKRINALFKRWNPELSLLNGEVVNAGSKVLSPRLADALEYRGDDHLEQLVETAIHRFQAGDESEKLGALTDIANVLERIKETLGEGDKRRAGSVLVANLGIGSKHDADFDNLLKSIANISNNMAIRHHEPSRTLLKGQENLVEFLFHMYYGAIRLALRSQEIAEECSPLSRIAN